MDTRQRMLCKKLIRMEPDQAIEWIMKEYPINADGTGGAIFLISHRSWRKKDQKILADYYFRWLPFASERGYKVFASIMSVKLLLECIRQHLPTHPQRIDLLLYYLVPVLNSSAKNDYDRGLIGAFLAEVSSVLNESQKRTEAGEDLFSVSAGK